MLVKKNDIKQELQMLTGVMSRDITHMYYSLIKDGTYFSNVNVEKALVSDIKVDSLEDWFNTR